MSCSGKPHKTMWVTDLDYVKKERDRCLELLTKKSQKRQQETACPERKKCAGTACASLEESVWLSFPGANARLQALCSIPESARCRTVRTSDASRASLKLQELKSGSSCLPGPCPSHARQYPATPHQKPCKSNDQDWCCHPLGTCPTETLMQQSVDCRMA